ncbi:MAG: hypothetical protein ROR55_00140 [Devosia sp.]
MPPRIKIMLTVLIIAIAALAYWMRDAIQLDANVFHVFGLTAFMVFAIWLFPEVKRPPRKGDPAA